MQGLARFNPVEDRDRQAIELRPLLSLCMDQHSSNFTMATYLLWRKQCRLVVHWDPFHRAPNDAELMAKRCKVQSSLMLNRIANSLHRGPWQGSAFWRQVQESALDLLSASDAANPLVQELLPRIAQDHDEVLGEFSFEDFKEYLPAAPWIANKGLKSAPSRWWNDFDMNATFMRYRYERLLVLCYAGLQQGWLKAAPLGADWRRRHSGLPPIGMSGHSVP